MWTPEAWDGGDKTGTKKKRIAREVGPWIIRHPSRHTTSDEFSPHYKTQQKAGQHEVFRRDEAPIEKTYILIIRKYPI
jgi:hypothetical protein